jgi:hypothetical protein
MSNEIPWFRRVKPDGSPAAMACIGNNGEILLLDNDWAASFKDGKWRPGILFFHEQIAEFSPVKNEDEVERLLRDAHDRLMEG